MTRNVLLFRKKVPSEKDVGGEDDGVTIDLSAANTIRIHAEPKHNNYRKQLILSGRVVTVYDSITNTKHNEVGENM